MKQSNVFPRIRLRNVSQYEEKQCVSADHSANQAAISKMTKSLHFQAMQGFFN
jgi:hypothetical protein